jgi:hypothetical protein
MPCARGETGKRGRLSIGFLPGIARDYRFGLDASGLFGSARRLSRLALPNFVQRLIDPAHTLFVLSKELLMAFLGRQRIVGWLLGFVGH